MKGDWEDFNIEIAEMRALDDGHVVIDARMRAHTRGSGVEVDAAGAWLCDVRDEKVTRIQFYTDTDSAIDAARRPRLET